MKHVLSIMIIFLLAAGVTVCKKDDKDRAITIQGLIGEVMIVAGNTEKPATVGDVLITGDGIRTGADSIADVLYGSEGIIRIQPDSNILLSSLMDPATGDSQLDMPQGKMYVTLSKLKKGDFRVKTPTAVASVRGTSFRITADEKASRLDVVTGAVRINPVQNDTVVTGVEKTVETNQTVELDEKAVKQAVEQKKEITVTEMKAEEVEEIRKEIRDIKPEMLEKLNQEARKEIREKVMAPAPDDSAEREKAEKETLEKQKKEKERTMAQLREEKLRAQKIEQENLRAQKIEQEKLKQQMLDKENAEKKKKQKENTPGESKNAPPSLQTL